MATNAVTLFNAPNTDLPAHIAAAFEGSENVLPRDTTPALTFRGKTWRLRQGGEEIVLTRKNVEGELEPAPVVKIVVLNLNQKRSRMYYVGAYEEGKSTAPVCWSSDGDRPDAEVPQKCASTCASCPNSVKGSKITANQKETTACSPVKRLAVVPAGKLDMEPLLLKVPQTSMWDKNNPEAEAQGYFAWDQYVDFLRQRGVKHTAAVVTKVKFDEKVAYPKLLFTAISWLEAEDVAKVVPIINSDAVLKLLNGKINEGGTEPETPPGTQVAGVVPASVAAPAAPPPAPPAKPTTVAKAPAPAPVTPPLAARPAPAVDDDGGDAFANVGKPVAASKPTPPPAPPQAPTSPKVGTVPNTPLTGAAAAPSTDLAALAAAWDD